MLVLVAFVWSIATILLLALAKFLLILSIPLNVTSTWHLGLILNVNSFSTMFMLLVDNMVDSLYNIVRSALPIGSYFVPSAQRLSSHWTSYEFSSLVHFTNCYSLNGLQLRLLLKAFMPIIQNCFRALMMKPLLLRSTLSARTWTNPYLTLFSLLIQFGRVLVHFLTINPLVIVSFPLNS